MRGLHCAPKGAWVDLGGLGAINISLLTERRRCSLSAHQAAKPHTRMNLKGKTAIITGGTKGIGRAIAEALLCEGLSVCISARKQDEIEMTVRELGRSTVGFVCDVRDYEQVKTMINYTAKELGGLDILVNNAGIGVFEKVEETSPEDFRAVLETRTGTISPAVRAVLAEIRRIRQAPVSERELALVKDRFINSYIFRFESPLTNVVELMQLEYDGRPANYYETLLGKIRAVTRRDILRVARTYLHPDQLTLLIVGDVREGDAQWSKFGRVTPLTLENPSAARDAGQKRANGNGS